MTLTSGLQVKDSKTGKKETRRGDWGDIVTGPFISFGFNQNDKVDIERAQVSAYLLQQMRNLIFKP